METKERQEKAVEYKHAQVHNNCAQSVLLAYQDELGKSREELRALGAGFGLGMGGMEATCGALTGVCMVLGLLYKGPEQPKNVMNEILQDFKNASGATICADLKGAKTHKMLCSCDDCIRHAIAALDKHL